MTTGIQGPLRVTGPNDIDKPVTFFSVWYQKHRNGSIFILGNVQQSQRIVRSRLCCHPQPIGWRSSKSISRFKEIRKCAS